MNVDISQQQWDEINIKTMATRKLVTIVPVYLSIFTFWSLKAFSTTETELNAIAAPATQGARKHDAAIGMPIVL